MADSKMAVSQWSTEFVQDLLPAAQKTALLYHLSYLCLAKFPNLERIIRARAVETQLLFGSSDATLLKCILTSENLVNSLFPILKTAVERNKPNLAVKLLKKAQSWIQDIITDVKEIVQKYDLHNRDVATSTSDVIQEKADTDKKITEQDQALKEIEITLNDWKSKLQKTTAELAETENKISSKTQEIQDFVSSISETRKGLGIFAAIVPFVGPLVKGIYEAIKNPGQAEHIRALEAELNVLIAEKTDLRRKQWQVDLQIIDWQMKAARASFDRSSIPDPVHLNEVQRSLSKIQKILIQLKDFWEKVGKKLDFLEKKTFVGKDLVEDLAEIKDVFFDSIEVATEAWISFGVCCQRASAIFRLQTRDAYSFLEVSPSSLSKDQWQVQYEIVKKQLEKIDPPGALMSSNTPALSE